MVRPTEPGGGGVITLVGAVLRPVKDIGAGTGPIMAGASEGAGADVGIEGGGACASS